MIRFFVLLLFTVGVFFGDALHAEAQPWQSTTAASGDFDKKSLLFSPVESQPAYLQTGLNRLSQERKAMLILLGWGSANLLAGGLLALREPHRDFGLMTAGWGLVNTGIAVFALTGADSYTASTSFDTILRDEQLFNRILAINSGLNAGYIGVGFAMNYLGDTSRVKQFGTAIMVQGAFLMGFDAWLLWNSTSRLNELAVYPSTIQTIMPDAGTAFFHALTLSFAF